MADRPVRELLAQLRAAGLTQRDVEARTGMSPRYQRFVASGAKSGEHYRSAFDRYLSTGLPSPAPRRRTSTGELAAVRGGRRPAERVAPAPVTPGALGVSTRDYAGGRGRIVSVGLPASEGPGRVQGRAAIYDAILRAAYGRRRVAFTVHTRDGRALQVGQHGGYRAGAVTSGVRLDPANGDVLRWIVEQGLREKYGTTSADVIGVDVIVLP